MSEARKCDICGTCYDPIKNEYILNPCIIHREYNKIKIENLSITFHDDTNSLSNYLKVIDICPECSKAITDVLMIRYENFNTEKE